MLALRKTFLVLALLAAVLSAASCAKAEPEQDRLLGQWSRVAGDPSLTRRIGPPDAAMVIEFRSDGTATWFGHEAGWYLTGNGRLMITSSPGSALQTMVPHSYRVEGDRLVIDDATIYLRN